MTLPRPTVPTALLVLGALMVPAYLVLSVSLAADVLYLVGLTVITASAAAGIATASEVARPVARLCTLALAAYTIGDLLWYVLSWTGGQPDGSVADAFYLLSYVLVGAVLLALLMPLHEGRWVLDVDVLIDVLTVVTVCLLLLWEFVLRDSATGSVRPTLDNGITVSYPVLDAVLIGLVLHALTHSRSRGRVPLLLGFALGCWLLADYGYLFTHDRGLFAVAPGALWLVGALLIAGASARVGAVDLAALPRQRGTAARLSLAIGPLLVPPVLVPIEEALGRDPENISLVVGIVALIALAFVRTERLLASERRTLRDLAITRDEALEASRAKSTFLAAISHEIRTPMNGVLGLSRLLAATELDEHQRQYAQGIEKAGSSLMTLLNDVLDFAKYENGRILLESIDFDVVELVEDVAAMVAEQAHHQGLELVAAVAPDVPRGLHGDPTKLRQVLLNLASNAVKFTACGEVVIAVTLEPSTGPELQVCFSVTDTGIGIAPHDQQRLFQAFTQVESATPQSYGGTGLGLAIVRELVATMGGEIAVDSDVEHGSRFWCTLPLTLAKRQQPISTRPSRALPGTRALVVDDNASSRTALHDQLAAWGIDVDVVSSATSAMMVLDAALVAAAPYHLVVADLWMPGTDGLELSQQVHARPGLENLPVLVLTSGPELPLSQLRAAGVDVTLRKPVQVARLQGAVQRALGPHDDRTGPSPATMGRGVVLVVEDSDVNQMVAVGTLRQLGYLTEVAANGLEAVEMVTTRNYDVVLMDCRMPVMDGYEAAAEIRSREQGGHRVPIIAVTAGTVPGDRERCLAAGMDDYLVKPLGQRVLASTLARWVPASVTSA